MNKNIVNEIIESSGNIIVEAGAGRGKTTLLSKKIKYDYDNNKDHRTFIALTFTNKAVNEIKSRLGSYNKSVSTIDSFIMQEIVIPFINHSYGDNYKKNNIERDFKLIKSTFEELLIEIKENSKIGVYPSNQKKDFISELAISILKKSPVACRYFKSKYYKIYIDEYQDVTVEQHNIFKFINESLEIELFILGDTKQNIYSWRGASTKGFQYFLERTNFIKKELKENYRCHANIQKFLNIFETSNLSNLEFDYGDNVKFITLSNVESEIISSLEHKICILTRSNKHAKTIAIALDKYNFKYIPSDKTENYNSNYKWLTKEIIHYILSEKSNKFNLINSIPFEIEDFKLKEIKLNLQHIKSNDIDAILDLFKLVFPEITKEEFEIELNMIDEVKNDIESHIIYNTHTIKNSVLTMHSSKGMEFDVVFVLVEELFDNYENIDYNLNYVSLSRAKEKLVIVYKSNNSNYLKMLKKKLNKDQREIFCSGLLEQ